MAELPKASRMIVHGTTRQLTVRPALHTNRGFAVLLYTYLVVSFLLMLSTTLLTLSTMDLTYAQRSVSQQQAFWAGEGQLETSIAQLRQTTPPALADGAFVDYATTTLLANKLTSTARLYGTGVANEYRLEATGTSASGTQTPISKVVSTVLQYNGAGATEFDYVAYADAITAEGLTTGSTDTRLSRLLTASAISSQGGNLATRRAARHVEKEWDEGHGRYVFREKSPIEIAEGSRIKGDIFLGRQWNGFANLAAFDTASRSEFGGVVNALRNEVNLPTITVPAGATSLGPIQLERNATRCLDAGSYEVDYLVLKKAAELCTVGTVNLYVTGALTENSDKSDDREPLSTKVWIGKEAKLYGQPSSLSPLRSGYPYLREHSPRDLRIFVKGEGLIRLGSKDSKAAALIYAPDSIVKLKAGTFAGAIIAKNVKVDRDGSVGSTLVYDRSLENEDITVGSSGDVQVKMWTGSSTP